MSISIRVGQDNVPLVLGRQGSNLRYVLHFIFLTMFNIGSKMFKKLTFVISLRFLVIFGCETFELKPYIYIVTVLSF